MVTRVKEEVTLHFDLGHCPQDVEFTLRAGDGKHYVLTPYSAVPEKMEEHRQRNRALALIPQDQLHRITHFVEDAELYGDGLSLRSVVYPSQDDHPLPELALVFVHIPREHRKRAFRELRGRQVSTPHNMTLAFYGVTPETLSAARGVNLEDVDEIEADAASILPPFETAKTIIFHHPEIGTCNPTVAQQVFSKHVQNTQDFHDLYLYISTHGSGAETPWYKKTYVTWKDPETGEDGYADADTDAVDKNGNKVQWPQVDGKSVIPQYDLSDEYNSQDPGVMGMASPVVHQVLIDTKNDPTLNGQLWTKQNGITQRTQTNVAPTPTTAPRLTGALGAAPKGWIIKNQTSSYGLDLYPDKLQYDASSNKLSFPVKNWPNRYLGAYVQFYKTDGTTIPRSGIQGWYDDLPDFLQPIFEPSSTKNYLSWISSGNQVFGIPFPTNPVTLEFVWPQDASRAEVLLGGLGVAEGFKDWDSDVDILAIVSTGAITYGLTALSMAFTVYVINPVMSMLSKNTLYAIYGIAAAIGIVEGIVGGVKYQGGAGKWILSKLANQVGGILFGQITKVALKQVYKEAIGKLIAEFWGLIDADEALELIPFSGWALKVSSVAADIAALTATTVECVLSPATYDLEVLHTMDLTVTVKPDPAHGKSGEDPIWPLVSDHFVITVTYPKAAGQSGGTTYAQAGPMPGDHTAPIVVTFPGIPAGGQCEVVASIYSATNWLAGRWDSGWINASPDTDDQLAAGGNIVEYLVPLTSTTSYSQKQRVIYDGTQQKHLWQLTQFSIDASLSSDLDDRTLSPALQAAFQSNGNSLSPANEVDVMPIAPGSNWQLVDSGTGITYQIVKVEVYNNDNQPFYELSVQNVTNASPQLPPLLKDCTTGGDNHNVCDRVNITINNKEYQLGYTWQASGQNLPLDDGTTRENGQMFAFQSISTLGEPEDSVIEPTRGFSQQPYLAFNQFGLTPVFYLPLTPYQSELNAGGDLPPDLAQAFSTYNLPTGVQITPVTANQEWYIGVPGSDPLYDLRVVTTFDSGRSQQVIDVYSYPVPSVDNFYIDPRSYVTDGLYHLRGVAFSEGQSTFDYSTNQSWGAFTQAHLDAVAVHPQGYVVGVDYGNHKMFTLRLPANAVDEADAPLAMPLSGEGVREGLMYQPAAMTIAADGRILVLEQGNQRIQAFDVKGNPVPSFAGPLTFSLPGTFADTLDARTVDTDLIQAYQQNVTPALAPLFSGDLSSVDALDNGTVDAALTQAFHTYAYDLPEDSSQITVLTTRTGSLWLLTDAAKNVTYDIRVVTDQYGGQHLFIYYSSSLSIVVNAAGEEWTISDATNALTFDVRKPVSGGQGDGSGLAVRQLVAVMALRDQSPQSVTYLDVAVEAKGYIYVLASTTDGTGQQAFQLDIYNPDGSTLLAKPQTGINAAKLTVDQWRTLFTMNYDRVLGPGGRTEPGISAWIPSTPSAPGVSA